MKIAIVEDREQDRTRLLHMVTVYLNRQNLQVTAEGYGQGEEFCAQLQEKEYDIVFLDVYLGTMNGMDIARQIRDKKQKTLLVFVTTSRKYAVESYQVRAFYYLVKPFSETEVQNVLELCEHALLYRSKFVQLHEGSRETCVLLSDIICAKRDHHYIEVVLQNSLIRTRLPLCEFLNLLDERFLLCNRHEVINMEQVAQLYTDAFLMKNRQKIEITARNYDFVQKKYFDYVLYRKWINNRDDS